MYSKENITAGGPEILIVEDSPTQAIELEFILKQNGYRTSVAGNGREALAWLGRKTPDMVISDIVMPELDGYELCRAIRENEKLRAFRSFFLASSQIRVTSSRDLRAAQAIL